MSGDGKKQFVSQLSEKTLINDFYLIRDKAISTGKNGKAYLALTLVDSSGEIDGRVWDNVDSLGSVVQDGEVFQVKGIVQIFQGRRQAVIHRIEKVELTAAGLSTQDFIKASGRPAEEVFEELKSHVTRISDEQIKQLVNDVIDDPDIRPLLLTAPAARTIHHAWIGGLLEHTVSICDLMVFLKSHYNRQGTKLNLDYLIFGAIFHDIGKIWELEIETKGSQVGAIRYTDRGRLIGHMVMAVELVERKASRILGFKEETKDLLKHIILSHHGRLEYGSPKVPLFLEAFLVAAIDDLDSKVSTIDHFLRAESRNSDNWTRFSTLFDRHFYLKT